MHWSDIDPLFEERGPEEDSDGDDSPPDGNEALPPSGCVVPAEASPRLRRSAAFDDRYYSDATSVHALTLQLAKDVESALYTRRMPGRSRRRLERTIECLLVNLLRLRVSDPGRYLAVKLGRTDYRQSLVVTYRSMRQALKGLEQCGYVRLFIGKQSSIKGVPGLVTRVEALPRLLDEFARCVLGPVDIQSRERQQLVELRPSKQERRRLEREGKPVLPLPWPKEHRHAKALMEANLRTINGALRSQFVALYVKDSEFAEIHKAMREEDRFLDYFDRDLHRVFTIDPTKNGRFAGGWWATVPSGYRKLIRMSAPGKHPARTVEIDFSELHLRMLYAKAGALCTDSPYALYDDPKKNEAIRPAVKLITLRMINADSTTSAKRAVVRRITKTFERKWWDVKHPGEDRPSMTVDEMAGRLWPGVPPIDTVMTDIRAKHSEIAQHFSSGAGRKLMFEDSQLAEAIMLRMIEEYGVAVLPLHDGFIARHDYRDVLQEIMQDEFRKRYGAEIPVKETTPGLPSPWVDELGKFSTADCDALMNIDRMHEEMEYGIYHALLDDWIARQPPNAQPDARELTFLEGATAGYWSLRIPSARLPHVEQVRRPGTTDPEDVWS